MKIVKFALLAGVAVALSACGEGGFGKVDSDKTRDYGFKPHDLSKMTAGIWIDPNGCDHWMIDDGVEGYLSQRLDKYGKPVCSDAGAPSTAVGPYRQGETISDLL
ncbi:MAG: hypothetical protein L3J30_04905 [Marinosulfonomonas sp.]|nr:hypothetical protein [Marinosulfonomonas sp.]